VGQNFIRLHSTQSTNDYLKDMLAKSTPVPEGTVIMAVHQSAGKGQQGATWQSEPGKNLTFSLLLKPHFLQPIQQFDLTVAVSLAIVEALAHYIPEEDLQIKWPNDISLKGKKMGGVLIENTVQGMGWKHAVVGIGLNVQQSKFSEVLQGRATSLWLEMQKYPSRVCPGIEELLHHLCLHLENQYVSLHAGWAMEQRQAYLSKLFQLNENCWYEVQGQKRQGRILGVSEHGRLMVDFSAGTTEDFGVREIRFLNSAD